MSDENHISDVESMIIPDGTTLEIVDLDRDNERVWLLRSSNSWPKNSGYGFFGVFGPGARRARGESTVRPPRSGLGNVSDFSTSQEFFVSRPS